MATLPPLSQGIRDVLMSDAWFASLPESVRADMLSRAHGRVFAAGQWVFSRGDEPEGLYVVIEGIIRLSGVTREGRETILDFYGPGFWFGEISMLDGGRRMYDAVTEGHLLVLQLGAPDLEQLLEMHPAFSRALLRLEAQRLRLVLSAIESYSAQSMKQRLANRFLILAERHGTTTPRGVGFRIELSHETLARLIGTTRQRVNQILNEWKLKGLVEHHYGRIVLVDIAALKELARI